VRALGLELADDVVDADLRLQAVRTDGGPSLS
jgi:hypothetical protein